MIRNFFNLFATLLLTSAISGCEESSSDNVDLLNKGRLEYHAGNYKEAAKWYKKSAEQGNAEAQFYLGNMYDNGAGVAEDDIKAAQWFAKAAEQGDALAQFFLERMRARGESSIQDDFETFEWFRKAAEQGNPKAQYYLGLMYKNGRGVTRDKIAAHSWFNIATTNGYKDAKESKKVLEESMEASQIAKAREVASLCFKNNDKGCR